MSQPRNPASEPAPSPVQIRPTILIVDGDAVGRRYLELALGSTNRYQIEVAEDCNGAIDLLSGTVVNLVISDVKLADQDGFYLLRRIRSEPRWRSLPVFFTAADIRPATRVSAFQMGVDDFISKPLPVPEMVARVDAVIRRVSNAKSKWRGRRYELAGNFRGLCFSDLVTILENGQRTGILTIMTRRAGGAIFFEDGKILHATFGSIAGNEAVYRFFAEQEGEFEFFPGKGTEEIPATVNSSPTGLMLEAARRMDHAETPEKPAQPRPIIDVGLTPGQKADRLSLQPDGAVAQALAQSLEDPFTLGEMQMLGREELGEWMNEGARAKAVQVLLLCETEPGVLTISTLSSPLSEGQISKTLAGSAPALGLNFDVQGSRSLRLLLLDPEQPSKGLDGYPHQPAILIVGPPGGDWMGFSISARVALMEFLRDHPPTLVLGLGHETVADGLEEVAVQAACPSLRAVVPQAIDDPSSDIREILCHALDLWCKTPAASPQLSEAS